MQSFYLDKIGYRISMKKPHNESSVRKMITTKQITQNSYKEPNTVFLMTIDHFSPTRDKFNESKELKITNCPITR